jgi:hypothetical protein
MKASPSALSSSTAAHRFATRTRFLIPLAAFLVAVSCSNMGGGDTFIPATLVNTFLPPTDTTIALRNPLTGFHQWRSQNTVPGQTPVLENYQRYHWRDLEPQRDQYQFSALLNDLAAANAAGRSFAFRIRMMAGYDDGQRYVPDWLNTAAECAGACVWEAETDPATPNKTFVPDWNHPFVLARAEKLLAALGNALPATASIAWIDIGMYGQYGEWALSSAVDYTKAPAGITPVTQASKEDYIDMHLSAFPGKQLLMFALRGNVQAITYAASRTATAVPTGLRTDCLGRKTFFNQWLDHPADYALISSMWKTAPFVAEFCGFEQSDATSSFEAALTQLRQFHISTVGNGNFGNSALPVSQRYDALPENDRIFLQRISAQSGARLRLDQFAADLTPAGTLHLASTWHNEGTAPVYHALQLVYELRAEGKPTVALVSEADLRTLNGEEATAREFNDVFSAADNELQGEYTLVIYAKEPRSNRKWMLFNRNGNADTTWTAGSIRIDRE